MTLHDIFRLQKTIRHVCVCVCVQACIRARLLYCDNVTTVVDIYFNLYIIIILSHLWADHRLSRTTKLRLYRVCVCSSLIHCCEAWTLNRTVTRSINWFNSRCLHIMTFEHYRETATAPVSRARSSPVPGVVASGE